MKLALECPTEFLEMIQPFSDFDLILVDKLKKEKEYLAYYSKSTNTKFLDNSTNELGQPAPLSEIIEWANKIKADYLVPPDFLGDYEKTAAAFQEALKSVGRDKLVGVVQGSTFQEAVLCLSSYEPGWVAVPYDICSKKTDPPELMALKRALFVTNIPGDKYTVHLLGYNSLTEFFWYELKPYIASIDTGAPVMLGLRNLDILDPLESKEKPTLDMMEGIKLDQKSWSGICRNIALLRKYLV